MSETEGQSKRGGNKELLTEKQKVKKRGTWRGIEKEKKGGHADADSGY